MGNYGSRSAMDPHNVANRRNDTMRQLKIMQRNNGNLSSWFGTNKGNVSMKNNPTIGTVISIVTVLNNTKELTAVVCSTIGNKASFRLLPRPNVESCGRNRSCSPSEYSTKCSMCRPF